MLIYIKSGEAGWETERQIELPDDEKLVRAILRSVKRHLEPPKTAGGGIEEKAPPEPAAPAPENKKEEVEEGYRGFLLVKCQNCGKIYAYNARGETTESTCRECGHVTPLRMLAQALFECPECGTKWNYKTNLTDADAACRCVRCGAEMRSRWHKNLRKYVPQE
jgi:hypothetical protein